jgi:hypothetical protein
MPGSKDDQPALFTISSKTKLEGTGFSLDVAFAIAQIQVPSDNASPTTT